MDHNYASSVLPSYLGVSQHDPSRVSAKSQKKENTYVNIRNRLRSSALTVAYEKGLNSLSRVLNAYNAAKSPPNTAFGRHMKFDRDGYGYHLYERTASAKSVASSLSGVSTWNAAKDLSPLRAPPKVRKERILSSVSTKSTASNKSKNSLSTFSSRPSSYSIKDVDILSLNSYSTHDSSPTRTPNSRFRKERIMSSVSTKSAASTSSRPSSYSSREAETLQMFWTLNLNQIQELKERYSENSEFIISMYEEKLRRREHKLKKTKETEHDDIDNGRHRRQRTTDSESEQRHEHRKSHSDVKNVNRKIKKVTLNDAPSFEDDIKSVKSAKSGKSLASVKSDSSSSTLTPRKHKNDDNSDSKYRKVGFNLKVKKKESMLPPIPPSDRERIRRRKPKSILKRQDSNLDQASMGDNGENNPRSKQNITSPRLQFPKLSPVPQSATPRKQATAFKSPAFNDNFKCSKEFATAFRDFRGSPLRPLSRSSSRNESVRSSSRSSSKIENVRTSSRSSSKMDNNRPSSQTSSKNGSLKSDVNSTIKVSSLRNSHVRLSPITSALPTEIRNNNKSDTPTLSKVTLASLQRRDSKQVSESTNSRSNSTLTVSSIRKI